MTKKYEPPGNGVLTRWNSPCELNCRTEYISQQPSMARLQTRLLQSHFPSHQIQVKMPASVVIMDDIGVVATITGVTGAGLRLSLLLNAVACQVANSGVDIHSISKGISLFASTLKQVGQTIQAGDSVHTREALDTARHISDQAQAVFDEIEDMLDKVQSGDAYEDQKAPSVQQSFKSCFKKQRVIYLLAHLESLKLSLAVMLQVLQLGRLMEMKNALGPPADELIAYERADTQNMIIVRYWSIKRLDRLWGLARKEALDAEKEATLTNPNLQFATSAPPVQPPASLSDTALVKLPVISVGDDASLSAMEDSPKDMLRLIETVLESLLARWVHISGHRRLGPPDASARLEANVRAYVSSGSEVDHSGDEFEGHTIQGYYLEGTTTDWRKPHSQEARQHAAHLRKRYSDVQALVESDSEDSDHKTSRNGRLKDPDRTSFTDESNHLPEQSQIPSKTRSQESTDVADQLRVESRPYAYTKGSGRDRSSPSRRSYDDLRPIPQVAHAASQPQALQTGPAPMPQQYNNGRSTDRVATSPRSPPKSTGFSPSGQVPTPGPAVPNYAYHMPNGLTPPAPDYQMQAPRYHPPHPRGFSRSTSDNSQPQPLSPPRRGSRSRKGTTSSSHRETDRHRNLMRTATRGILGASAIAGFMDALDAFSII
ncbi:hypothetical protein VTN77DRAFT_4359 [Rasamsonia byssochlamydoides]|uniref:uncharacterized protein n=1 Tax=Rasamsonia byssochlamydoides TaxID=89139 RepID=UPI0037431052